MMSHNTAGRELIKKISISENWIKIYVSILNVTIFIVDVLGKLKLSLIQLLFLNETNPSTEMHLFLYKTICFQVQEPQAYIPKTIQHSLIQLS